MGELSVAMNPTTQPRQENVPDDAPEPHAKLGMKVSWGLLPIQDSAQHSGQCRDAYGSIVNCVTCSRKSIAGLASGTIELVSTHGDGPALGYCPVRGRVGVELLAVAGAEPRWDRLDTC